MWLASSRSLLGGFRSPLRTALAFPSLRSDNILTTYRSNYEQTHIARTKWNDRIEINESHMIPEETLSTILRKSNTKFHLSNLPTKINKNAFERVLEENGIRFKRIKKFFGMPYAKIDFENQDQARDMLRKLSTFRLNDQKIFINTNNAPTPDMKISDKRVEDVTTPWWDVPYEEQLERKREEGNRIMSEISREILNDRQSFQAGERDFAWVDELANTASQTESYPPLCPVEEVVPSPQQTSYRNKIGFSIGRDASDSVCIGFVMGKFKEGIIHLADPSGAVNSPIHPTAMHFRQLYEDYIKNESRLPVYHRVTHDGFWRGLEIRTFNTGESSLTFQVKTSNYTEDEIEDEMGKVVQILALNPQYKHTTTVFFQDWSSSSGAPPVDAIPRLVYGRPYVHETLHLENLTPLTFRVQPTAFFQTNSGGCELLYNRIVRLCREVSSTDEPLTVLDVCCGTGTIGISVAHALPHAQVHGVDIVEASVQDAQHNAKLNQVDRASFITGDARVAIHQLTAKTGGEGKCVAILDPPRAGVHKKVIKALLACDQIDRIVYVACNPNSLLTCIPDLCKKFQVTECSIVDMFPQTAQMEMILCLDRCAPKE